MGKHGFDVINAIISTIKIWKKNILKKRRFFTFYLLSYAFCLLFLQTVYGGGTDKLEVVSIRFFTAGKKGIDKKERVYNDNFIKETVSFIWYELAIENRFYQKKSDEIVLTEEWLLEENNNLLSKIERRLHLTSEDRFIEFCAVY